MILTLWSLLKQKMHVRFWILFSLISKSLSLSRWIETIEKLKNLIWTCVLFEWFCWCWLSRNGLTLIGLSAQSSVRRIPRHQVSWWNSYFFIGKSPYLMFTNRHEIRRIDLVKKDYTQVVPTLKNAVALDVDVTTNKMYWCDLYHRKIFRYTQH